MDLRAASLALALSVSALAACGGDAPPADASLEHSARVRFTPAGWRSWTSGVVGSVGPCRAIMVPESWVNPQAFSIIRIDSLTALRLSDQYDVRAGEDGGARVFAFASDTAGETWTEMDVETVRERHGGCDPAG